MSWCTSGVGLQVLPFIDNSHLWSILRFQWFSCLILLFSKIAYIKMRIVYLYLQVYVLEVYMSWDQSNLSFFLFYYFTCSLIKTSSIVMVIFLMSFM